MDYGEVYGYQPTRKSHKGLWLSLSLVLFMGIVVLLIIFLHPFQKNISQTKLTEGASIDLTENKTVKFKVGDEDHGIKIDFIGLDSVDLTINSDPIQVKGLKINEVKKVDLDGDGTFDLRIKLVSIENGKATIAVKKIEEVVCEEDWECEDWNDCVLGAQGRECTDKNSCGTIDNRPDLSRSCLEVEIIEEDDNETENESVVNETNLSALDCGEGEDYSCFINASKTCYPSKWIGVSDFEEGGIDFFIRNYFEIKGYSEDNKCVYYTKVLNYSVSYTDETLSSLIDQGFSQGEVDQLQEYTSDYYNSFVGTQEICKYNQEDLTNILVDANEGVFSSSNSDLGECYPHDSFDCKLDFEYYALSGLELGGQYTVEVKGFSDASKVVWSVENSSVVLLSSNSGSSSKLTGNKIGKTFITIKDTSVENCQLRWEFDVVAQVPEEPDSDYISDCNLRIFEENEEIVLRENTVKYWGLVNSDTIRIGVNGINSDIQLYENKFFENVSMSVGYLDKYVNESIRLNICFDAA